MKLIIAFDSEARNPRLYEIQSDRILNLAFIHKLLARVIHKGWLTEKKGESQKRLRFYIMVEISDAKNSSISKFVDDLRKYRYEVFQEVR